MDILLILLFFVALYILIAGYIRQNNPWPDAVTFYGPILALRTRKVGFFDHFRKFQRFFKIYGTLGALMVGVVMVFMTLLLLTAFGKSLVAPLPFTAMNELPNLLAIPGLNDFIPFTVAVWLGLILTLVVHEGGHGILARVENLKVKSTGILFLVVPIGAFVEPDEEEMEQASWRSRVRVYGAGITNNLVVAGVCFLLIILCMGLVTPSGQVYVTGVYEDFPADQAGIMAGMFLTSVGGVDVNTAEEFTAALATTRPGQEILVTATMDGVPREYPVILTDWPEGMGEGIEKGFMGVVPYDSALVQKQTLQYLKTPLGPLILTMVPIDSVFGSNGLGLSILAFESPEVAAWQAPFPGFWFVVQLLFWAFWFNLLVGTFNALPFIPLDGGYIMHETVTRFFEKRKHPEIGRYIVTGISSFMIFVLLFLILVPYLAH